LFRGDPFDLDLSGTYATPVAAELLRGADLVVAWGCALSPETIRVSVKKSPSTTLGGAENTGTRNPGLISPDAVVIQVDANPGALGVYHRVDLGIPSDAGTAARAVLAELTHRGQHARGYRTPEVGKRLAAEGRWRDIPFITGPEANVIDPRTLTIALDDLLPVQRTVAVDAGDFTGCPVGYLNVGDETGFLFPQAYASTGLGLAGAIGAATAFSVSPALPGGPALSGGPARSLSTGRPGRLTVAALSAESILRGAGELETAVRLGLGHLLVVVYDDDEQAPHDFASIARGYGCAAVTVRAEKELAAVQSWLDCDRGRPLLVDAKVARLPA
jgi:thiamine pyrophosphate-dependent acetolactate synthase large subunit-like protein